MAYEQTIQPYTCPSCADLSDTTPGTGPIYKAVDAAAGDIAAAGLGATGILRHGATSGEHMTLATFGIMKFTAAGSLGAGCRLTVAASGYMAAATSGSFVVGRTIEAAVSSGAIGTGLFNFHTVGYKTASDTN